MGIRISAEREMFDPRTDLASLQPHRSEFLSKFPLVDPLDPRLESPLGQLRLAKKISEAEYEAGCRWRRVYLNWLKSIGAPNPSPSAIDYRDSDMIQSDIEPEDELSDEACETIAQVFRTGEKILKESGGKIPIGGNAAINATGRRVFDAVNALVVYEEPDALGDFEYTALVAKKGLAALAEVFA